MRRAFFLSILISLAAVSLAQSDDLSYYDSLCSSACIDSGFPADAVAMCNDMGYESQVEVSTDACFGAFWNGYPVEKCFCGTPTAAAGQTQIPEDLAESEEPQQQNPFPEPTFTPDKCGTHNDIAQCYYDEACESIGDCCSGFDYDKYCRSIAQIPPETAASSEVGGYGNEFSEVSTSAEKECPAVTKLGDCENVDNKLGGKQCYFVPQKPSALTIKIGDATWSPFEGDFLANIFGAAAEATKQIGGKCEACPASAERCDYANNILAPGTIKKEVCKKDMCGQGCQWALSKCVPADSGKPCKAPYVGSGTCRNINNCNAATYGKSSQCLEGEVCCNNDV